MVRRALVGTSSSVDADGGSGTGDAGGCAISNPNEANVAGSRERNEDVGLAVYRGTEQGRASILQCEWQVLLRVLPCDTAGLHRDVSSYAWEHLLLQGLCLLLE